MCVFRNISIIYLTANALLTCWRLILAGGLAWGEFFLEGGWAGGFCPPDWPGRAAGGGGGFSLSCIWGCWGIGCLPWEYKSRIWWQMSEEHKIMHHYMKNQGYFSHIQIIILAERHRERWNAHCQTLMWLPSSSSTGTSCTNCSHQRRDDCLDVHSWMSNLHSRPARYMTATAMISGSHWRDNIVQRLEIHTNMLITAEESMIC